jgi:hypothetical protein
MNKSSFEFIIQVPTMLYDLFVVLVVTDCLSEDGVICGGGFLKEKVNVDVLLLTGEKASHSVQSDGQRTTGIVPVMDCHEVSEIGMIWQKQHSSDNILIKETF